MTETVRLADRGVLEISGTDAGKFLHGLVTNDILTVARGEARFAALLTPQGKILFDFLVFALGDGRYLIDCPISLLADLKKRLEMYRLRAQVAIADRSGAYDSVSILDREDLPNLNAEAFARDPRSAALGWRAIVAKGAIGEQGDEAAYEARRIGAGVPKGGLDFAYGDAFPHEANMDLLNGLDFGKGCYVGQEVVSRMKHRGNVRKRVTRYRAQGDAPAPGEAIRAGGIEIGVTGSRSGEEGLALVRLDRLEDALAKGATPLAAGVALRFPNQPT
jgi:hypothetical protein